MTISLLRTLLLDEQDYGHKAGTLVLFYLPLTLLQHFIYLFKNMDSLNEFDVICGVVNRRVLFSSRKELFISNSLQNDPFIDQENCLFPIELYNLLELFLVFGNSSVLFVNSLHCPLKVWIKVPKSISFDELSMFFHHFKPLILELFHLSPVAILLAEGILGKFIFLFLLFTVILELFFVKSLS